MKKTRRYAQGDEIEDESDRGEMTADQQANSDATNAAAKPASQSFKDAFASARSGGDKTFTWNGKSYTTELASSKPAAKAELKPAPKAETPAPKAETPALKAESKPAPKAEAPTPKAETKAETKDTAPKSAGTYRDISGKVRSKTDEGDSERAANRSKLAEAFSSGKKFREMLGSKYKSGGSVSSRGDGIAQRGRTKGTFR